VPEASTSINKLAKIQREVRETMAENQALKQENAALLGQAKGAPQSPTPKLTAEEIKIDRWKELAEDDFLSEETRVAAKQNVDQIHALELAAFAPSSVGRQEFRDWLGVNRLLHHESNIIEVCGLYVTADDFPLMCKEDQDAITSAMTNLEAARFVAAVRAPQ
jgi:hypothetical protein